MIGKTFRNALSSQAGRIRRPPRELLIKRNPAARIVQNDLFAKKPSSYNFRDTLHHDLEPGQIRFNEPAGEGLFSEEIFNRAEEAIESAGTPAFADIPAFNHVEESQTQNAELPGGRSIFGIDAAGLKGWRNARTSEFFNYTKLAMDLRADKAVSNRYTWVKTKYEDGGEIFQERVLVRRQTKTWTDRVLEKAGLDGGKVQAAFNQLSQTVRHLAGVPRKTGSSYVGTESIDPLLTQAKGGPVDAGWAAQGVGRTGATTAANEGPLAFKAGFEGASEALTYAAAPLAVADAMGSANEVLQAVSERDRNKAAVLAHHGGYLRFLKKIDANKSHTITSEEVDAFLSFTAAAQKLFKPTRQESRTVAAIKARFARLMVMQPLTVATTSGIAIASHVAGSNPVTAAIAAPLTMISAAVEIREATQSRLRRLDQQHRAEERKAAMKGVVDSLGPEDPELELLKGIVAGLSAHQDDLIEQAKREKGYARLQAGKAAATIGGGTAFVAAAGVVLGGVIAATALSPAAPLVALPALGWGGAIFKRGRERASDARKLKWQQRAVAAVALTKGRKALEELARESEFSVKVSFQEGEYLPEEEGFAGKREMEFRASENPYVGLHLLALQVQDMVKNSAGNTSCVRLLNALHIDALDLFAICQKASFKDGKAQLDYIQSQLAIKLDMPLKMEGDTQPLPHPSVFIGDFKRRIVNRFEPDFLELAAEIQEGIPKDIWKKLPKQIGDRISEESWKKIPKEMQDRMKPAVVAKITNEIAFQQRILPKTWEEVPEEIQEKIQAEFPAIVQQEIRRSIREELKKSFPDETYMEAFDAVIGKFLKDTQHLPDSQLTKLLRATVPDPSMQSEEVSSKSATPSVKSELSEAKVEVAFEEPSDLLSDVPAWRNYPQAPELPQDGEDSRDSSSNVLVRPEEPPVPGARISAQRRVDELKWLDDELQKVEALPPSRTTEQREKARRAEEIDTQLRVLQENIKASDLINQTQIRP
ncbi:hypothetical protein H4CHR_00256 [Variovorax sp. PBS-H4]|uniref:hypothetical protein n=1 Tax=Variovorax sp. PBS-H4 TaxID=434008 RepID=UPI00131912B4|nr:hypothetical protein [Variovorax sp. PBS-H4]VTU18792.1 hypothetical protein H4CHR_00256 [Variovorax sp. PBS-H4]